MLKQSTIEDWLRDRITCWPLHMVHHRARLVDRFLDFLVSEAAIPSNPFAELRIRYEQRTTAAIVHALLDDAPGVMLEALRQMPRFASFLGEIMRHHIDIMRTIGYRYSRQEERFVSFDRFLQGSPDLAGQPLPTLLRQWYVASPTLAHDWERHELGRDLAKAWRRIDPSIEVPPVDRRLWRQVKQQRPQPYIFTPSECDSCWTQPVTFRPHLHRYDQSPFIR